MDTEKEKELVKEFDALDVSDSCEKGEKEKEQPPSLPRSGSDPVVRQSDGSAVVSPDTEVKAVDVHRSSSDSQTSRNRVL